MKIIGDLPNISGKYVKNITSNVVGRNMVFLPLTKRAVLQYCLKILVKILKVCKLVPTNICRLQTVFMMISTVFTEQDMSRFHFKQHACIDSTKLSGRDKNRRVHIRSNSIQTEFQFSRIFRICHLPRFFGRIYVFVYQRKQNPVRAKRTFCQLVDTAYRDSWF